MIGKLPRQQNEKERNVCRTGSQQMLQIKLSRHYFQNTLNIQSYKMNYSRIYE